MELTVQSTPGVRSITLNKSTWDAVERELLQLKAIEKAARALLALEIEQDRVAAFQLKSTQERVGAALERHWTNLIFALSDYDGWVDSEETYQNTVSHLLSMVHELSGEDSVSDPETESGEESVPQA